MGKNQQETGKILASEGVLCAPRPKTYLIDSGAVARAVISRAKARSFVFAFAMLSKPAGPAG
jgi:hypothetical protein